MRASVTGFPAGLRCAATRRGHARIPSRIVAGFIGGFIVRDEPGCGGEIPTMSTLASIAAIAIRASGACAIPRSGCSINGRSIADRK